MGASLFGPPLGGFSKATSSGRRSLPIDIPEKKLKKGDVATVVEHHPVSDGEDGYSLEVFNALGDTITVITVPESAIELLTENEIFSVRSLAAA